MTFDEPKVVIGQGYKPTSNVLNPAVGQYHLILYGYNALHSPSCGFPYLMVWIGTYILPSAKICESLITLP